MTKAELQRLVMAMAERIAGQSEALGRAAAKVQALRKVDPLPLLVGEAMPPGCREPLGGRSGRFLARLLGVELAEFHELTERVNLVGSRPGRSGKGRRFPLAAAERRARTLPVRSRTLVLLGKRVALAFGLADPPWLLPVDLGLGEAAAFVVPHPSGIVRWWNGAADRRAAAELLRKVVLR